MAVFRLERTRDYTVMSNHHLRDKRLSLKAKGLLSQMLSLRVLGELSFRQIGLLFGKTKNWARVTYHRARLTIKEELE